jgi:hypothetical protein
MTVLGRWLTAFGRFWWDFLVGDTPELFLGVLVVVATALLLRHDGVAAVAAVPLECAVLVAASVYRGRSRS